MATNIKCVARILGFDALSQDSKLCVGENYFMSKLRTIPKAFQYVKSIDPESDITLYLIRKLAEQEKISITKTGRKILVDVDSLLSYLSGEQFTPSIITVL